jgi:hypothetical protein
VQVQLDKRDEEIKLISTVEAAGRYKEYVCKTITDLIWDPLNATE